MTVPEDNLIKMNQGSELKEAWAELDVVIVGPEESTFC